MGKTRRNGKSVEGEEKSERERESRLDDEAEEEQGTAKREDERGGGHKRARGDKVTRKSAVCVGERGAKEETAEDEGRGAAGGDGRSVPLAPGPHTIVVPRGPGAFGPAGRLRAARKVVREERREDHQSSRGEWRVLCNHGAEPRADKPNQKR